MKLYIKNMVCDRCKMVVETALKKAGFNPINIDLGEVELAEKRMNDKEFNQLNSNLQLFGFELLVDKKARQVNQVKSALINLIQYPSNPLKTNLSAYLSQLLKLDYSYLSMLFSEREQLTIEKYFLQQKIEKVKELLTYGEKSLSEIAYELNYSSVAHLSAQFKKIVGQTPSNYKSTSKTDRRELDSI